MGTWTIGGPAFLSVYGGALALLSAAASDGLRRSRRRPAATPGDLDDYDIAVLNGEPSLATAVALLALDVSGVLELGDRMVRQLASTQPVDLDDLTELTLAGHGLGMEVGLVTALPGDAHPVEVAVYRAVVDTSSRRVRDIRSAASAMPALEVVGARLVELGLRRSPAELTRRRRRWLWFVPLLLLGLIALGAGLSAGRSVSGVVALLVLTICVTFVVAPFDEPVRTKAGEAMLGRLRAAGAGRSAGGRISRQLAVHGSSLLWSSDRPLALALGSTRLSPRRAVARRPRAPARSWRVRRVWLRRRLGCGAWLRRRARVRRAWLRRRPRVRRMRPADPRCRGSGRSAAQPPGRVAGRGTRRGWASERSTQGGADELRGRHGCGVRGRPPPFEAIWSHADGISLFGAIGSYTSGWSVPQPGPPPVARRYCDGTVSFDNEAVHEGGSGRVGWPGSARA